MGRQRTVLARGRVLLAQGRAEEARSDLYPAHAYFRAQGLYYNEAQACVLLAACEQTLGEEQASVEHLRRALDLAARYDYEYWLQRVVAQYPQLFTQADAAELLPQTCASNCPGNSGGALGPVASPPRGRHRRAASAI